MDDSTKSIWSKKANSLGDTTPIHWRVPEWFSDLGADKLAKLKIYYDELMRVNKAVNLIGVKTIPMADAIHFADSILASRHIAADAKIPEIYDFGSGNGFPGLIYALMNPATKVVCVDSDERKCEFIKHTAAKMSISNIQVLTTQIEKLPDNSVQYGMSRGLASISKAILILRKPFKKTGVLYHMKGEEWFTEVSNIPTQLCAYWKASLVTEYRLPIGEIKFAIAKTEKFAD